MGQRNEVSERQVLNRNCVQMITVIASAETLHFTFKVLLCRQLHIVY